MEEPRWEEAQLWGEDSNAAVAEVWDVSDDLDAPEENNEGHWNTAVAEEWDATDDVDAPEEVSYPWSEPG